MEDTVIGEQRKKVLAEIKELLTTRIRGLEESTTYRCSDENMAIFVMDRYCSFGKVTWGKNVSRNGAELTFSHPVNVGSS